MQDWAPVWLLAAPAVVALAAAIVVPVWLKGRPLRREGRVFRASRWSGGNRLFPTQVVVTPASVIHYTPQWIGKLEHSIHLAHVASVRIDTNLLFSNVYVETTGGASPIMCRGHHKADAIEMKGLIEKYQTEYYRGPAKPWIK